MERVFRVSAGFRVFYGIILLGLILFFTGIGFMAFATSGKSNPGGILFVLALIVPCTMALINVFVSKVTISAQSISRTTLFGTKELLCTNVKGCRIEQKFITIEPLDETSLGRIVINNYIDFADRDDLKKWLAENFADLNGLSLKLEREKLLQNLRYGATEAERKSALKKAKTVAISYNVIGVLLMFTMIFVDEGHLPTVILMGYPLLGIIIIALSNGLTKFVSSAKTSINPFVMPGMVMPIVITIFKSLGDFEIYSYAHIWLPWLAIGVVLFAVLYALGINHSLTSIKVQLVMMLIFCCMYGYCSTIQVNCVFDNSEPKVYTTSIYNKTVNRGKSITYYLSLNQWENGGVVKDIAVSHRRYNASHVGDTINVATQSGLLHIPWFYLP